MEYNPSKKGWESIVGLPIDEKIIRIRDADVRGLVKGINEAMHDVSTAALKGEGEIFVDLPLLSIDGGRTLNELVGSRYKGGRLEIIYRRSLQDSGRKEVEFEEVVLSHFIWGRVEPEWKKRERSKDNFEDFTPTQEEQAMFHAKCLEAVVRRHERLEKQRKAGKKTVETLGVNKNFL